MHSSNFYPNFVAGEPVEKQIIVINNSRVPVGCDGSWSLALPQPITGQSQVTVETGQQAQIPIRFVLPPAVGPGEYRLSAKAVFSTGQTQEDTFVIHVLPRRPLRPIDVKTALFDPKGETTELLKAVGWCSRECIMPSGYRAVRSACRGRPCCRNRANGPARWHRPGGSRYGTSTHRCPGR